MTAEARQEPTQDRVIRLPEVVGRVAIQRSHLYALVRKGLFPPPLALGGRAVGWRESDIADWIAGLPPAAK